MNRNFIQTDDPRLLRDVNSHALNFCNNEDRKRYRENRRLNNEINILREEMNAIKCTLVERLDEVTKIIKEVTNVN